jgi:hypothetical protein
MFRFPAAIRRRGSRARRMDRHIHDARAARRAVRERDGGDGVLVGDYSWQGGAGIRDAEDWGEIGYHCTSPPPLPFNLGLCYANGSRYMSSRP